MRWPRFRGVFLLLVGVLFAMQAVAVFGALAPVIRERETLIPIPVWGWVLAGCACSCWWFAFRRNDRAGFIVAISMGTAWTAAAAEGWLIHHLPRAWASAGVWGVLTGLILLAALWDDPPERVELPPMRPRQGR